MIFPFRIYRFCFGFAGAAVQIHQHRFIFNCSERYQNTYWTSMIYVGLIYTLNCDYQKTLVTRPSFQGENEIKKGCKLTPVMQVTWNRLTVPSVYVCTIYLLSFLQLYFSLLQLYFSLLKVILELTWVILKFTSFTLHSTELLITLHNTSHYIIG